MSYYRNYTQTACIYTAIHSSYGLCWLLKDAFFRDPRTDDMGTVLGIAILVAILVLYWYIPFMIIAGRIEVPAVLQAVCVGMCMTGSVLMMVADCHKHFALKYNEQLAKQKKYLIHDGVFSTNRNPNYLGEMLVYGGFALMTGPRLEALSIIGSIWVVVFITNMWKKDLSLQKKPGWEAYNKRSHLFLFKCSLPTVPRRWKKVS